MPTWGKILTEINEATNPQGGRDYDGVRRKYLRRMADRTGRAVILYATAWLTRLLGLSPVRLRPQRCKSG